VDFKVNGSSLTGCSSQPLSSGAATCATANLSVGAHTVAAAYGGNSNYLISTGNLTQTVNSSGGGYVPPPVYPPITPPVTPPVEPPVIAPVDPPVTPPLNNDSDNDGQNDALEVGRDTDGDGVMDNLDRNDDNDGIDSIIEAQAPERPTVDGELITGDGNGDGIEDTLQANVTSLPFLHTSTAVSNPGDAPPVYVTLAASGTNNSEVHLTNVTQEDAPPDLPDDPAAPQLPLGLISFTAELPPDTDNQDFELFIPSSIAVNGYWKQTSSGGWANLASAEHGGSITTNEYGTQLNFTIADGGPFDNDGVANGSITDPGGPGYIGASGVVFLPINNGLSIFERLKVYGQRGQEGVRLNSGVGTILDQNIDGIVLPDKLENYQWTQAGNTVRITGTNLDATLTVRGGRGTEILSIEGLTYLRLDGTRMLLGNQMLTVNPQRFTAMMFGSSLETTVQAVDAEFFSNTQPNRIFLYANARFTAAENSYFYGQTGYETVVINNAITGTFDQNIERVELDAPLASYFFRQQGNTLKIQRDENVIITIAVQADADGTLLVFRDGTTFVHLISGGRMFLGNRQLITADTWLQFDASLFDE
jgi:hypothetical protein